MPRPSRRTRPDRRPLLRTGVLAVLTVLAVPALAACGTGDAEVGTVLDEDAGRVEGTVVEARVPSATIELAVGQPVDEVGDRSAPDGAAFVPIGWTVDRIPAGPLTGTQAFTRYDGETEVAVLADGDPVDLVTIDDRSGSDDSRYVVLPDGERGEGGEGGEGEPTVTFEVTYDGVTQTLGTDGSREAGIAEPLYDAAADGVNADCSDVWRRPGLNLTCLMTSWVLPATPDHGWATEGNVFVVVDPVLDVNGIAGPDGNLEVAFTDDRSTVDQTAPDAPLETGLAGEGSVQGLLVVEVPEGQAHTWQADLGFEVVEGPRSGRAFRLTADLPLA